MRLNLYSIGLLLTFIAAVSAAEPAPNRTYVQSSPDGLFYARCVPERDNGASGSTKVYKVGREKDELLDTYDWYTPRGVTLGFVPTDNQVAVLARGGKVIARADRVELSFHLGGKLLTTYTSTELSKIGIPLVVKQGLAASSHRTEFRPVICDLPGTTNYVFVIETEGKRVAFDARTGKPTTERGG